MLTKSNILVVGGAGFIGSHMMLALEEAGYHPIALDNLCNGHRHLVHGELIEGDLANKTLLDHIFAHYDFQAVMHFASLIEVAESVRDPNRYYQNNIVGTLNLLSAMNEANVKTLIFSSSAAVYGEPHYTPIDEKHALNPINPYGRSKRMIEEIINDHAISDGLRYASLRYYNAAGADPQGRVYENHHPESHIIPLLLEVARNEREYFTIYGSDYDTPDGTCIRDYVHVQDICQAHLLALQKLINDETSFICNLGTGKGYSVKEVISTVENITGVSIKVREGAKRSGDPAILVADANLANILLSWKPKHHLQNMIEHAWHALNLNKKEDAHGCKKSDNSNKTTIQRKII